MKILSRKNGFTLIEIIIAMAIMFTIISVVYGTYFAARQSVDRCNHKISCSRQARSILTKMARQIRCAYHRPVHEAATSSKKTSTEMLITDKDVYPCLVGGLNNNNEVFLRLITTAGIFYDKLAPQGPFAVEYKYDTARGILFYSQEKYAAVSENNQAGQAKFFTTCDADRNWLPLAEKVESIQLSFYDGQCWGDRWNSKDKKDLPLMVKISIVFDEEQFGLSSFSTTACVNGNYN